VTWQQDKPGWTNQDELAAATAELLAHLRDITIAKMTGAKLLPPMERLFEHPDRPDASEPERRITKDPAEVAQFFAQHFKS
jgi:hypothetical protein